MNFTDPLYDALALLCRADAVDVRDAQIACRVPTPDFPDGYVWASVSWDEYDALIEREWIETIGTDDVEVQPTQSGKYHHLRWEREQEKAARGVRPNNSRRSLSWRRARRR